jgi:uncharacterized protein YjdB
MRHSSHAVAEGSVRAACVSYMRMPRPTRMWWVAAAMAAGAVAACQDDALDPSGEPVATVEVAPPTATVAVGASVPLTATALDAAGNVVTGRRVIWASADPNFATVSDEGVVTGRYVGTVPVAASVEGKTATAQVVVTPIPVVAVRISPSSRDIAVDESAQLTAEALDARGAVLSGRSVEWTSSRPNVASVSGSGVVTGLAPGAAAITATIEGKSGVAAVTVSQAAVATVAVAPSSATLTVGETTQLQAEPRSASGQPLSGRPVTWVSSASQVASVTSSGLVTALSQGTATITASSEGRSGTASIVVQLAPVDHVDVVPSSPTVKEGQSIRLTAWVYDERNTIITGHTVTWTSEDTRIATVDNTGLVRGVRRGTVTITATAGGKSGTARVRVEDD